MSFGIKKFDLGDDLRDLLAVTSNVLNRGGTNTSGDSAHGFDACVVVGYCPGNQLIPTLTCLYADQDFLFVLVNYFTTQICHLNDVQFGDVIGKNGV